MPLVVSSRPCAPLWRSLLEDNKLILARREQIRDTNLVVDCRQLQVHILDGIYSMRNAAADWRTSPQSANLVVFGGLVRLFLATLIGCNITPIFVADGEAPSEKELVWDSSSEREMRLYESMKKSYSLQMQLPAVAAHFDLVFRTIARELGFRIVQAFHESGTVLTRLANELHCPVLTGDADFILRPVDRGFILVDQVAPPFGARLSHLDCLVFRRDLLLSHFPCRDVSVLPLLGVVARELPFQPTIEAITGEHRAWGRNFIILCELDWMSTRTCQQVLEVWSGLESLDRLHKRLLEKYRRDFSGQDMDSILGNIYAPKSKSQRKPPQRARGGAPTPPDPVQYLTKVFAEHYISKSALRVILDGQISGWDQESRSTPNRLKRRIYSILVALLRPVCGWDKTQGSLNVEGIGSEPKLLGFPSHKATVVEPLGELESYGSLDRVNAHTLARMSREEKQRILVAAFRFKQAKLEQLRSLALEVLEDELYANELAYSMLLIRFINIETSLPPVREFVRAIVWSIYYYKQRLSKRAGPLPDDAPTKSFLGRLVACAESASNGPFPRSSLVVPEINSFRVAYEAFASMNGLLDGVLAQPRPDGWFNGQLIERLAASELQEKMDPPVALRVLYSASCFLLNMPA